MACKKNKLRITDGFEVAVSAIWRNNNIKGWRAVRQQNTSQVAVVKVSQFAVADHHFAHGSAIGDKLFEKRGNKSINSLWGTTDIDTINAVARVYEGSVFDLQGRKLDKVTEPGIYIVNGKKVFVQEVE